MLPDTDPDVLTRLAALVRERTAAAGAGMNATAVVLMAYGSPDRLDDVPAYYADIRGGRPIASERLADLVDAVPALGNRRRDCASPLNASRRRPALRSSRQLALPVYTGMRHWQPRIADAVERALDGGADAVVGLVLAPHWSTLSIAGYEAALRGGGRPGAPRRVRRALGRRARIRRAPRATAVALAADAHVVFTAHSLPARILADGDPYADELLETSRSRREAAGIARLVVLLSERVADGRAVARPGHPRTPRRAPRAAA